MNDVLHCDFSIRPLHTLEFFSFAFFRKQFSLPFHLTNYLPILALVLANVWWDLGRWSYGWKNEEGAHLSSLFDFKGDNVGVWNMVKLFKIHI